MGRKARQRELYRAERQQAIEPIQDAPPPANRRALLIVIALLVCAIAAVYAQVGAQDFINYDDPLYVSQNTTVQKGLTAETVRWAFTSFHGSHWHPLTTLTHLIDVELFGLNAGAHKLVNVAFHAGATILLLLFLVRATGALWPSAVVAALFALHPTRVESVAWIAERKDVLSAFFFMAALFLYAGYVRSGRKLWRIIAVTVAFACALMSKPSAITLPFVLLLLDYWPFRRFAERERVSLIVEKVPMFALIIPAILVTLRAQSAAISPVPLLDRISNALLSAATYLRMLVWPAKLAIFYPYRTSVDSIAVIGAAVLLIAITAFAVSLFRRAPFVTVGWLWFLGILAPMSGLVQAGRQAMADRFTYIPFVGLFIAIVWGLQAMVARPQVLRAAAIVVVAALSAFSFAQTRYWKDSETVFGRALDVTSNNALAHINVGSALYERGAVKESLAHCRAAASIEPRNPLAHNGVGFALAILGEEAEAIKALRRAIALDPGLTDAYRRLAQLELHAGRPEEAAALLQKAHATGGDATAQAELAAARGDIDAALAHFKTAVEQKPDDFELRNNYAAMLARKGRDEEALQQYLESIRIRPNYYDARMNVGALLSRAGRNREAADHFTAAAALRPNSPEPHVYLALVYANSGQPANAIGEVDAALKIDRETANRLFTNAVRIEFKETNLYDFRTSLQSQVR